MSDRHVFRERKKCILVVPFLHFHGKKNNVCGLTHAVRTLGRTHVPRAARVLCFTYQPAITVFTCVCFLSLILRKKFQSYSQCLKFLSETLNLAFYVSSMWN